MLVPRCCGVKFFLQKLRFYSAERMLEKTITIHLDAKDGKKIVELIDDATAHRQSNNER